MQEKNKIKIKKLLFAHSSAIIAAIEIVYPYSDNCRKELFPIKLAISSDNHLDVNKVDPKEALNFQAQWLTENKIDYYLYGGDLFNDFAKTRNYFEQLQQLVPTNIFYILGNHDMLNNLSFEMEEDQFSPLYLHNRFVDIPNTDWRIIANNGWYDYSFSSYSNQPQKIASWKNVFWLDSSINQPLSDQDRMSVVLRQVKHQLINAQAENKQVLFLTHFAPRQELLAPKPRQVNSKRREYYYQMINAMMGSKHLGELLESFPNVRYVFYGHLHGIHPPLVAHNLSYLNQAVGVNNKRINEWQADNFFEQWKQTIRVIDLY